MQTLMMYDSTPCTFCTVSLSLSFQSFRSLSSVCKCVHEFVPRVNSFSLSILVFNFWLALWCQQVHDTQPVCHRSRTKRFMILCGFFLSTRDSWKCSMKWKCPWSLLWWEGYCAGLVLATHPFPGVHFHGWGRGIPAYQEKSWLCYCG